MSELVVIAYPDEHRAAEVLATLRRMRSEDQLDLDDAASVTKDQTGRLRLLQQEELTAEGVQRGQFWRRLAAVLFEPEPGVMSYAGAAGQRFGDIGIDETYMKRLGEHMQPGSSAILVLVRDVTVDKVLPAVGAFGGVVLRTTLSPEAEARLRSAVASPSDAR